MAAVTTVASYADVEAALAGDDKVQVAGTDVDGVLRGKVVSKAKFLSSLRDGMGFCGVIFGWDIHDRVYSKSSYSTVENGFRDIIALPDLRSFRRVPWNGNMPFFLMDFMDDDKGSGAAVCPRGLLKRVLRDADDLGFKVYTGVEFEFYNFLETPASLASKHYVQPEPLTPGMFGYSLLRPARNRDYFNGIMDGCNKFGIPIEGLHTETGPGVYEAAIEYSEALEAADRATLFKSSTKEIAMPFGIMPSFMAKPNASIPGCSGHTHYSLWDKEGKTNLFADPSDARGMSKVMKHFLAGQLRCLPDILPMFMPFVNSYKRMVENAWAPVVATWGVENRTAAIRVINLSAKATRVEVRVGGADINSYLCIAAAIASGLYGIKHALELPKETSGDNLRDPAAQRLPANLGEAARRMAAPTSVARELFGDAFVDHYTQSRLEEWGLYSLAITDFEIRRYFELA